ncbi:MAG: hypothetical protein GDA52_03105 [Rhodobacteraceae bacterium]|nr:hypothetical protein [Paracoccaceae bacterium]
MWGEWWVWMAGGLVLAVGEVILPSYVLLGFGIGAGLTGLLLLAGGPVAALLMASVPILFLTFAVLSLLSWLALRHWLGVNQGQVRTFDHDINE